MTIIIIHPTPENHYSNKKQKTRKICNMKNETELITDENNNEQYMVFGSHRVFAKNNAFCKQEIAEAVVKYFEDKELSKEKVNKLFYDVYLFIDIVKQELKK